MMRILRFLAVFVLVMGIAAPVSSTSVEQEGLEFTYFGAAGWKITDGKITVLVDPYISRLQYTDRSHPDDHRKAYRRDEVGDWDTDMIDQVISDADFILIHHSHYDHLGDVPYIAKKTGAKVIGTETAITILRAYGIPNDQLYTVGGGEDYQFENFSVRVVPAIHSALGDKRYHDSRRYNRETELEVPLRINQFIEGGSLSFLARFKNHNVLTMGSMNFLEREYKNLKPDILLAGINGSRLGLYKYDERLINVTSKPRIIIPTHWDSFNLPYSFSQEENVNSKLIPFKGIVARIAPKSTVIIPKHLEPFLVH
jgi:L-ascorbate metabolism protein UlaG (beta-lactamase superfamily)